MPAPTIYPDINALHTSIVDRIRPNGAQEITGQVHQDVLIDLLYNMLNVINTVSSTVLSAFPAWSSAEAYTGGVEVVVRHEDKLWLFVSATTNTATEPGTNSAVWREISALELAHFRNQDQKLDEGGPYEVTASELWDLVNNPVPFSRWHNPVSMVRSAPTGIEADGIRYLVQSGSSAFAGQDGNIAEKKSGVWVFTVTADGDALRNLAEPGVIYLKDAGSWSVNTLGGTRRWHDPVNGTIVAPLGTEAVGSRWAILPDAEGPFLGQSGNIAVRTSSGWNIQDAQNGDVTRNLGWGKQMLTRVGANWVVQTPTLAEVLESGADAGGATMILQRPLTWVRGDQTISSPGTLALNFASYARLRVFVNADVELDIITAQEAVYEVELINTSGATRAITYAAGKWTINAWMPTSLAAGERVYMTILYSSALGSVINSSLSWGTAALTSVDTSDALLSNSNGSVPGVAAVRNYIAAQITALVNSSPATLDTLNELATALGNDPNFATTITTALAGKQNASAVLTTLAGASANGQSLVTAANYAAMRTLLGLVIGINVQAWSAALDGWAGKAVPAGDVVGDADAQTLKAKTIRTADGNVINVAGNDLSAVTGTGALAFADSPVFTGTPTAPTQATGNNTNRLATTAFVQAAIASLVNSSPAALDTLNELATALGNDPNFATTITTALAGKQGLSDNLTVLAALTMAAGKMVRWTAANTAVTQDISSTPAASTVPISDAGGTLNAWVSAGSTSASGIVRLAANEEVTAGRVVQSNDYRMPVRKRASSTTSNTTTTLASVASLAHAMEANAEYEFEADIIFRTAAGTTGILITVDGPSGVQDVQIQRTIRTGAGQNTNFIDAYQGGTPTSDVPSANTNYLCRLKGTVRNGATAGDLNLVFASEVAGSEAQVRVGSWTKMTRII